jgi:hypothetical protein
VAGGQLDLGRTGEWGGYSSGFGLSYSVGDGGYEPSHARCLDASYKYCTPPVLDFWFVLAVRSCLPVLRNNNFIFGSKSKSRCLYIPQKKISRIYSAPN